MGLFGICGESMRSLEKYLKLMLMRMDFSCGWESALGAFECPFEKVKRDDEWVLNTVFDPVSVRLKELQVMATPESGLENGNLVLL